MRIQYVGPHAAVDLPLPGNKWAVVKHGDTVEVDDEQGKSLLEQKANWRRVGPAKETKASKPADKPESKGGES